MSTNDLPGKVNFTQENLDEIHGKETEQDLAQKRCPFISSFLPIPTRGIMTTGAIEISGIVSPCIKKECMFWEEGCLIRRRLEE